MCMLLMCMLLNTVDSHFLRDTVVSENFIEFENGFFSHSTYSVLKWSTGKNSTLIFSSFVCFVDLYVFWAKIKCGKHKISLITLNFPVLTQFNGHRARLNYLFAITKQKGLVKFYLGSDPIKCGRSWKMRLVKVPAEDQIVLCPH